jgi:tetratricopeptide (TPR) repeat protein
MRRWLLLAAACVAASAHAEPAPDGTPKPKKRSKRERADDYDPASAPKVKKGAEKTVVVSELTIVGRVQKPLAAIDAPVPRLDAALPADLEGDIVGAVDAVDALTKYAWRRNDHRWSRGTEVAPIWAELDPAWARAATRTGAAAAAVLDTYLDEHGDGFPGVAALAVRARTAHGFAHLGEEAVDALAAAAARLDRVVAAATDAADRRAAAFAVLESGGDDAAQIRAVLALLCSRGRALSTPPVVADLDDCAADGLDAEQTAYAWWWLGNRLFVDAPEVAAVAFPHADVGDLHAIAFDARANEALIRLDAGRRDEALDALDAARRHLPYLDDPDQRGRFVGMYVNAVGADDRGLLDADMALAAVRTRLEGPLLAEIVAALGEGHAEEQDHRGAALLFRAAVDAAPDARGAAAAHVRLLIAMARDPGERQDAIDAEVARVVETYGEGSAWRTRYGSDERALGELAGLVNEAGAVTRPELQADGTLATDLVVATVRAAHGALSACTQNAALDVRLRLTVGTDGSVSARAGGAPAGAARCMERVAGRWRFPAPRRAAAFELPIRFEPR